MTPIAPLPIVRSMLYRPSVCRSGASAAVMAQNFAASPCCLLANYLWGANRRQGRTSAIRPAGRRHHTFLITPRTKPNSHSETGSKHRHSAASRHAVPTQDHESCKQVFLPLARWQPTSGTVHTRARRSGVFGRLACRAQPAGYVGVVTSPRHMACGRTRMRALYEPVVPRKGLEPPQCCHR